MNHSMTTSAQKRSATAGMVPRGIVAIRTTCANFHSCALTFQYPLDSVLPHSSCVHMHEVWEVLLHCVIPARAMLVPDLLGLGLLTVPKHPTLGDSHTMFLGNALGLQVQLVMGT